MARRDRDARDELARAAARRLRDGRAASANDAIRQAKDASATGRDATPSTGRVRQHAKMMEEVELGEAGYRRRVVETLRIAEEVMDLLATLPGEPEPVLVGRAARGLVDGDVTMHFRVRTDASLSDLAELFVAAGYEEPSFATLAGPRGRFGQLVVEESGVVVKVARVPPSVAVADNVDLATGRPTACVNRDGLRKMMAAVARG